MVLRSKNKLHFINGSLPRPLDEDPNFVTRDRCNTMIMSWIHISVESEITQSILWMDNVAKLWNELKDRLYKGHVFRTSDIQEEICNLKQGDSSISSYYTKLKKRWQEVDNFRPILECFCDSTCQTVTKIRAYIDGDKVMRVYSLLVQQERQATLLIDESKVLAFPKSNHSQNYNFNLNSNFVAKELEVADHLVAEVEQDGTINNYVATTEKEEESQVKFHEENEQDHGNLVFTPDQHKALLALLQGLEYDVNHDDAAV
ncbi:uncharacterized protein LOC127135894 [Lathyrus oleraceus]|uniref:uncharacterized protein LOC127135894 n=1 Tax=Pisum sativum TaxID=3888 RepID=UPI0021CEEFC4|nr:uncharacterized protein LOC127135894 [Pisum sativum]